MGSHHPAATLAAMIDALPEGCLLALDEAYVELAPDGTAAVVAADDPRVIRFRTFSKAHGMAGLRLGYALAAPDLALAFDKVRNHFGVGRIAQAGGIAALADRGHLDAVRRWAVAGRERLAQIATANGLRPLPSATNFVTMDCGKDGAYARAVMQALIARDIFVRMPGVAPLDRCIRVSLGNDAAYAAFAQALPLALADVTQA
jgi:histidinol-phosphate aminotransferase